MDSEEEYELLPHGKIEYLRTEIDRLKADRALQSGAQSNLLEAVQRLHKAIDKLYDLFDNVEQDLLDEYKEGNSPNIRMQRVIEQNEQIIEILRNNGFQIPTNQTISQTPAFQPQETPQRENYQNYQEALDYNLMNSPNIPNEPIKDLSEPNHMNSPNIPNESIKDLSEPKMINKTQKTQEVAPKTSIQSPIPTSDLNKKMQQAQNARQKPQQEIPNNPKPINTNFSQPVQKRSVRNLNPKPTAPQNSEHTLNPKPTTKQSSTSTLNPQPSHNIFSQLIHKRSEHTLKSHPSTPQSPAPTSNLKPVTSQSPTHALNPQPPSPQSSTHTLNHQPSAPQSPAHTLNPKPTSPQSSTHTLNHQPSAPTLNPQPTAPQHSASTLNPQPINNILSQPVQKRSTHILNPQPSAPQSSTNTLNFIPKPVYNRENNPGLSEVSQNTREPEPINSNFPRNDFPSMTNKKEFGPPIDVKPKSKKFLGIFGK